MEYKENPHASYEEKEQSEAKSSELETLEKEQREILIEILDIEKNVETPEELEHNIHYKELNFIAKELEEKIDRIKY